MIFRILAFIILLVVAVIMAPSLGAIISKFNECMYETKDENRKSDE